MVWQNDLALLQDHYHQFLTLASWKLKKGASKPYHIKFCFKTNKKFDLLIIPSFLLLRTIEIKFFWNIIFKNGRSIFIFFIYEHNLSFWVSSRSALLKQKNGMTLKIHLLKEFYIFYINIICFHYKVWCLDFKWNVFHKWKLSHDKWMFFHSVLLVANSFACSGSFLFGKFLIILRELWYFFLLLFYSRLPFLHLSKELYDI